MRRSFLYLLSLLCLSLAAAAGRAEQGDWGDPSWQLLRQAHIHRDGASLAAYLREQCGDDADLKRIDALVRQFGSADFDEREAAQKALTAAGSAALAQLRAARHDPDAEIARRAAEGAASIEGRWKPERALAAVRVLVRRGPEEAVPTLLRFLPYADFEELQDAVWFGLDALVVRQGRVEASLVEALRDAVPMRRAAAACIVGRRGDMEQRAAVRKLLDDADPEVRLWAAQGLLAAKDAAGLPALTGLLEGTPVETAWQAEELLRYVAGADAPKAIVGAGAAADRRECRRAWEVWWKEQGPKIDLAKLDGTNRRPGLMLLCDGGLSEEATGRVWLIGCDGVTRWELRKLSYPADARLVAGGQVMVAERSLAPAKPGLESGVSARGLDGMVLWRYQGIQDPMLCQPLPDGHILIAGRELRMAEVDGAGVESTRTDFATGKFPGMYHSAPPNTRVVIRRLNEASRTSEWSEVENSVDGLKILNPTWFSCYILSPDGLAAVADDGLVVETSLSRVERFGTAPVRIWRSWNWKQWIPGILNAEMLSNGHALIGGMGRAAEIDGDGRAVWTASFEDQAQRVRPCMNRVRLGFDAPRAEVDLGNKPADWLQGLGSKDPAVRRRSADAIRQFGPWTVEASFPLLTPLAKDADEAVRDAAERTLRQLSSDVPPELLKAMRDRDRRVQQDAALTLYDGRCPSKVVETLIGLLKDEDPHMRWWAANLLSGGDREAEKIIPALIEAVRNSDNIEVRQMASHTLGQFGKEAKAAIPVLLDCVRKEPEQKNSGWSMLALGEIDPLDERVFPVLIEAAQGNEPNDFAVAALGKCRSRAKEVIPVLLKLLEIKDRQGSPEMLYAFRLGVISELGTVGPEAKSAVPALAALERDKSVDRALRCAAIRSLGEIGTAASAAIPDLEKAKKDKELGDVAAEALEKIQGD